MSQPPFPRARRLASPGWLDGRLVLGVLLVLVSVVVGARVLSSADRSTLVYAVTRDLPAGSVLADGDLQAVRVRLFDNAPEYIAAGGDTPAGYVVRRALGGGELLPREALSRPGTEVDFRMVTVPVEVGHLPPDLRDGQQVDVWVSPDDAAAADATDGAPAPAARLVLQGVTVLGVQSDGGGFGGATTIPVVLQVRPREVEQVVSAMSLGRIDLVRVPRAAEGSGRLEPAAGTR